MLLTRRESPTLENFLDYHNWLSMLQIFFQAVRPKTLSASVIPVITGSSVAYVNAHFSWGIFLLTLISPKPERTAPIRGKTGINQAISEA